MAAGCWQGYWTYIESVTRLHITNISRTSSPRKQNVLIVLS